MRESPRTVHRRGLLAGSTAASIALWSAPLGATAAAVPPAEDDQPVFATDIRLPGLLHAVIARPPVCGARLTRLDASQALHAKGVVGVVALTPAAGPALVRLGGVAVLAHDSWMALKGRDALRLAWSEARDEEADRAAGDHFVPETAESLMEPPSATVQAGTETCAAWACLRAPDRARAALAAWLGLHVEAVALHATAPACDCEGHRATDPAYLFEAARLSRATGGAPVSLVWTRADDIPFRTRPPLA